jgi:hypothetical protein
MYPAAVAMATTVASHTCAVEYKWADWYSIACVIFLDSKYVALEDYAGSQKII